MKKEVKKTKPIKIAFIGAHGTGKTTIAKLLLDFLKKKGYKVEFIEEIARKCPMPINENTTFQAQRWILFNQIAKEDEAEFKSPDFIICDRSVLDNYIYLYHSLGKHNKLLFNLVLNHLPTYDFLFYLPLRQETLRYDGVRNTNIVFQKAIDEKLLDLIEKLRIKVIKVNSFGEVVLAINLQ